MPDNSLSSIGASFRGPVAAAIFDWAGTVLDFGCIAPVTSFREAFAEAGIEISDAEARKPMGAAKREHVQMILAQPAVQQRWQAGNGAPSTEADVDRLYDLFLQRDAVNCATYSLMIPGVLETIGTLRGMGIAIGSTTGYPRVVMDGLIPLARAQGYAPDCCVTVSEVARGRPWPDMPLANALALGVPDVKGCVVVDDSPTGLLSGRAAGMWAIGICASGNEVGVSLKEWQTLDEETREGLRQPARAKLIAAGAHFVIDSVADLLPVIDEINARLRAGQTP